MVKKLPSDLFPINVNYQTSRLGPNRVSGGHAPPSLSRVNRVRRTRFASYNWQLIRLI